MKKVYAITDLDAKFIKKMEFTNKKEVEHYLNMMYGKGKKLAAYELSSSKKRLSKAKIKKLENYITALESRLNDQQDITNYKKLLKKLKERPASEGMIIVNQYFDTFLRETIPDYIWTEMGGK